MIEDGVVFNDLEQLDPNHRNEDFQRSFIYDIPIVKEPFLASNRAADGFLNVARYELYNKLRLRLEKQGLTRKTDPKAFEDAARWAMNMTGRGNMLKMFESPASQRVLNNTFYGARLMASRFNMLNPATYVKMEPEMRKEALKDIFSWTSTTMAIGGALAAAGAKVSLNPDDSDFLQARFGDKVYDVSAGEAIYIRTALRLASAIYSKATKTKHESNKEVKNAGESLIRFLTSLF